MNQDSNHGQILFQPKTTGFHDIKSHLILSEASFQTEKVERKWVKYSPGLVQKNTDPACWSLPGITAVRVNQHEIIPVYASSQTTNKSKEKNIFSVQTSRRDFVITKNPSGPESFPSLKNRSPSYEALRVTEHQPCPFHSYVYTGKSSHGFIFLSSASEDNTQKVTCFPLQLWSPQ